MDALQDDIGANGQRRLVEHDVLAQMLFQHINDGGMHDEPVALGFWAEDTRIGHHAALGCAECGQGREGVVGMCKLRCALALQKAFCILASHFENGKRFKGSGNGDGICF